MTLLPCECTGAEDDDLSELTPVRIPSVIASLYAWRNRHPSGAFEIELLIPKLTALMSALAIDGK